MVQISTDDILKMSAAAHGVYGSLMLAAPEKSHDIFMSKTAVRSDALTQHVGLNCASLGLVQFVVANTSGVDKTQFLKATAASWVGLAGLQLYNGLKTKKQKKDLAIANAVAMTGLAGLIALKLNGKV
eukprot:jgi/Mesvir1/13710/Mv01131-RA.1